MAKKSEGAVRNETPEELAELKRRFSTPRDAVAYIMDTFPIVSRKDEQKRVILEIYDEMAEAIRTGIPYKTRLDPPPGPPTMSMGISSLFPNGNPVSQNRKIGHHIFMHQRRLNDEFSRTACAFNF